MSLKSYLSLFQNILNGTTFGTSLSIILNKIPEKGREIVHSIVSLPWSRARPKKKCIILVVV